MSVSYTHLDVYKRQRQSDVALYAPRTLTLGVGAACNALSVLLDAAALNFLDVLNNIQVDACLLYTSWQNPPCWQVSPTTRRFTTFITIPKR